VFDVVLAASFSLILDFVSPVGLILGSFWLLVVKLLIRLPTLDPPLPPVYCTSFLLFSAFITLQVPVITK